MDNIVNDFFYISEPEISDIKEQEIDLAKNGIMGFSMPSGFCITGQVYRDFLTDSGLNENIASTIAKANCSEPERLRKCGTEFRQLIVEQEIPDSIKTAILAAYWKLFTFSSAGKLYVRVSASTMAEDQSDISSERQQENYHNIFGQSELLLSIKKCWASLWTDEAISCRCQNNIEHTTASTAVMVRPMTPLAISDCATEFSQVVDANNEQIENHLKALRGLHGNSMTIVYLPSFGTRQA